MLWHRDCARCANARELLEVIERNTRSNEGLTKVMDQFTRTLQELEHERNNVLQAMMRRLLALERGDNG